MGLTQKLGTIPLAIFTDSSNNVGIGAAASGSYKLQVTGTSNFTSTINGAGVSLSDTLNGTTANFTSSVTGNYFIVSPAAFTAQSGGLRLGSQVAINARNAANSADITLITTNSSDLVAIRDGALNINSSGNVGIGTSSPSYRLETLATSSSMAAFATTSASGGFLQFRYNTSSVFGYIGSGNQLATGSAVTDFAIANDAGNIVFATGGSFTERMRITSGGRVCINTTSQISEGRLNIVDDCNQVTPIEIKDTASNPGGAYLLRFVNSGGSVCGSIAHQTSTTTQYNTSSDYRLKTDLKDYNGLDVVSKIKTYDFEWIEDGNRMYGVLAHELAEIIPYAVNGEKDGEQMQGADYSKIVPVLIKAIQELSAKVSALENR